MSEWKPIKIAPVNGVSVLLASRGEVFTGWRNDSFRKGEIKGQWFDDHERRRTPTHWMPLPEPPTQKGSKE